MAATGSELRRATSKKKQLVVSRAKSVCPHHVFAGEELKKPVGGERMKRITAIIRREKLDAVKHAMRELGPGMTVTDVKGQGRRKGVKDVTEAASTASIFLPKRRLIWSSRQKTRSVSVRTILEIAKKQAT